MALSRAILDAEPATGLANPKCGKACAMCAGPLPVAKASRMARRQYCTTKCAYAHRRVLNPKRQKVCPVCKMPAGFSPRRFNARGITCSAKCGYLQRKLKTRKPRKCDECRSEYFGPVVGGVRAKFCSQACRLRAIGRRPKFVTAVCKVCASTFQRTAAALKRSKHQFCGHRCARIFNRGENSVMFRGDKDPNRGAAWNRRAESIRIRDGRCCKRCGKSESDNGEKLSVDHVQPWRSFEDKDAANHPGNLVSLCRNCHSYKTVVVERRMLKGDRLIWAQWVRSLDLPSAQTGGVAI